jgi:hypothetical protein
MPTLPTRRRFAPIIVSGACPFLAAPAEIRLAIYGYLAPSCFLPYVPHQDYMCLLSSCRQIRGELEHESLLALTVILQVIQGDHEETLINVLPLQRPNLASLMHITIRRHHADSGFAFE